MALLVLQPPDWVTYEGALEPVEPEGLLLDWAESLPDGWIGVPTYHPDWRVGQSMAVALSRASAKLRFLPEALSQGATETLLASADGMVTISSSAAMTGLLFGKRVAVVGRSPFRPWGVGNAADLALMQPLTEREAATTLAFLCHRYSHLGDKILTEPGYFIGLATSMAVAADPVHWLFEQTGFSMRNVTEKFVLPDAVVQYEDN